MLPIFVTGFGCIQHADFGSAYRKNLQKPVWRYIGGTRKIANLGVYSPALGKKDSREKIESSSNQPSASQERGGYVV